MQNLLLRGGRRYSIWQ